MNPLQKNKIDVSSLTPEEQRLFRLYGKLPSRSDHFAKHLKERKYFDSGDYAMSKAGKGDGVDTGTVGSQHPVPENIPHNSGGSSSNGVGGPATATPPSLTKSGSISSASGAGGIGGLAGSPAKESSSGLVRETSAEEDPDNKENAGDAAQQGIPIRS
ncbi:putative endosulphine family protein [Diaporthe ampelina]|uniref:mRNA stability protein n=1 Tax=Diaporthe ampelina TaxID=1214573 RepID=A0A0G2FJE8_9PEZI|nr:putative endosulphine family protein [Diaporthe ampelina]